MSHDRAIKLLQNRIYDLQHEIDENISWLASAKATTASHEIRGAQNLEIEAEIGALKRSVQILTGAK